MEWCLDFTDTVDWRTSDHAKEGLEGYDDLVAWSVKKGVLLQDEAKRVGRLAEENPSVKSKVMKDAYRLREAIYRIFSAVYHNRMVDQGDLDVLNEILSRGLARRKVDLAKGGFEWAWRDDLSAEVMLYPLAKSAADLLTSEDLTRVKECANEEQGCGSLFLDFSKGQTRRWCSMQSCGNRMKFRTYYERHSHLKSGVSKNRPRVS